MHKVHIWKSTKMPFQVTAISKSLCSTYKPDLIPTSVNYKIVAQVSDNGFKPFAMHSSMEYSSIFVVQLAFSLSCTAQPRLTSLASET